MLQLALFVENLLEPEELIGLTPEKIDRSAYRAINYTADRARKNSDNEIRNQINFPASYLAPSAGRLFVKDKAGPGNLNATILARHRATSLARFVTSDKDIGKMGLTVSVQRGKRSELERAFLMKLKSGNEDIDTKNNLGLAVRLEKGQTPDKAYKPVRISDGLFLLYGPSVNQVFKTVRGDVSPQAEQDLEREFMRLIEFERRK